MIDIDKEAIPTPLISIIIRTKNEERWIAHCLSSIFIQDYSNFEVIVVDNESTDHTIEVAKRFPLASISIINDYLPGYALNEGIKASKGEYIVCLSAHCIPKDNQWLKNLIRNFDDKTVAGVYGRQLPVSFSSDIDKRDLIIVFGLDRREQIKDYFFHNANSMLRKDLWDKFPFDETVSNIEDRVWGKAVINQGYKIIYDPDAAVYHHHGLHQGNLPERARGVVSVIESMDLEKASELPESMRPEKANIVAIIPLEKEIELISFDYELLKKVIDEIKASSFINEIYIISQSNFLHEALGVKCIFRNDISNSDSLSIEELLRESLFLIEKERCYPEAVLYVNYQYPFRPKRLFDELITDAQYGGFETIFPGFAEFNHFWYLDKNNDYIQVDQSLTSNKKRNPIYKSIYGLGCLTSSSILRRGKLIGGKIGILSLPNSYVYSLRYTQNTSKEMCDLIKEIAASSEEISKLVS